MLLGIIFLKTELIKPHIWRQNDFYALLAISKVKVQRKIEKSHIFESLPFLYYSIVPEFKGGSRANSNRIIYFDKK